MKWNTFKDEEQCDRNMENFLYCIEAAGGASKHGFAAIKLTALGRPQFLLQVLLQMTVRIRTKFQNDHGILN